MTAAHSSGQVLTFEGKNGPHFRAFTNRRKPSQLPQLRKYHYTCLLNKCYPSNFGRCLENRTVNTTQSSPSVISRIAKSPSPICLRFSASCPASSSLA